MHNRLVGSQIDLKAGRLQEQLLLSLRLNCNHSEALQKQHFHTLLTHTQDNLHFLTTPVLTHLTCYLARRMALSPLAHKTATLLLSSIQDTMEQDTQEYPPGLLPDLHYLEQFSPDPAVNQSLYTQNYRINRYTQVLLLCLRIPDLATQDLDVSLSKVIAAGKEVRFDREVYSLLFRDMGVLKRLPCCGQVLINSLLNKHSEYLDDQMLSILYRNPVPAIPSAIHLKVQ